MGNVCQTLLAQEYLTIEQGMEWRAVGETDRADVILTVICHRLRRTSARWCRAWRGR